MKKYLGVKIIQAEFQQMKETEGFVGEHSEEREGYKVVYEDGYASWSLKDVFEKEYKEVLEDANDKLGLLVDPKTSEWEIVGHVAQIKL